MRDGRHLAALLVVLGALALAVPAIALAGGSAGNNQYTNPFGGSTTSQSAPPQTSSTTAPEPTTSSAPPETQTSSTPPATAVSPATATTSVQTTSDPEPTATAASPDRSITTADKGLPRTGYAVAEIVGFGLVMVASGLVIRRRARRA
jgi:hypothetical protein